MSASKTILNSSEMGDGSHLPSRRKSSRKRKEPAATTTPPPAPSPDVASEASSSTNSKALDSLNKSTVYRLKKNPQRKQHGGKSSVPEQLQANIAYTILFFRRFCKGAIYRGDIKTLVDNALLQFPLKHRPFGRSGVTPKWIASFMKRYKIKAKNQDPLDVRRSHWRSHEEVPVSCE